MKLFGSVLTRQLLPPREPVHQEIAPIPETVAPQVDVDLAQEAAGMLGYHHLLNEMSRAKEQAAKKRGAVERANTAATQRYLVECKLAGLGIAPFSSESVDRYKNRMLRKANRDRMGLYFFVLLGSLVGMGLTLSQPLVVPEDAGGIMGAFLFFLALFGVALLQCGFSRERPKYTWLTTSLRGYDLPVPERVLETAVKVTRAIPEGSFSVDQLVQEKRIERVNDPFLVFCVGWDKFYLEVWDEPKFDGERA